MKNKKKKQPEPKPNKAFVSEKIEVLKEQIERLKKFYIDRHDESFYMLHKTDEARDFEETADCLQEYVDSLDAIQNYLIELEPEPQEITKP